jgi:hypothetical protein
MCKDCASSPKPMPAREEDNVTGNHNDIGVCRSK